MVAQGNISSFYTFPHNTAFSVFRKSVPCSKEKWKWGEHPSAQFHATYQKDKATQRRVVPHFTAGIMSSPPSNCFSCFGSASLMDFSPRKKSNWLFVPSSTVSSYYFSVASFNHLFSMFFLAFAVSSLDWISRNLLLHFVLDYGLWSRWLMLVNSSFIFMNREAVEVYNHVRKI